MCLSCVSVCVCVRLFLICLCRCSLVSVLRFLLRLCGASLLGLCPVCVDVVLCFRSLCVEIQLRFKFLFVSCCVLVWLCGVCGMFPSVFVLWLCVLCTLVLSLTLKAQHNPKTRATQPQHKRIRKHYTDATVIKQSYNMIQTRGEKINLVSTN